MEWFRFYHEALTNEKVQDMRPELFKFWVNFLCAASESPTRGVIESHDRLARKLNLHKGTVVRYCSECEGRGLLHRREDGALIPNNWKKRQPESDDQAKRKKAGKEKRSVESPKSIEEPEEKSVPVSLPVRGIGTRIRIRIRIKTGGKVRFGRHGTDPRS